MSDVRQKQLAACEKFRSLHSQGCFLLPNPWDVGSALYLEHLGYDALATTSSGFAFSRGLSDSVTAIDRDAMLGHFRDLAGATSLPVNADFQNGYADDPEAVAANVTLAVETGVAGVSIEDMKGNGELYDTALAIERVKSARRAIDASGIPVILTARCEAWLVGHPEPARVAHERLAAFAEAGADCLYAPGVKDLDEIAALVQLVAPKPLNVLVSGPSATLSRESLAAIGVRRISVGAALARVAWGAFDRTARSLLATGTFDAFDGALPFNELDDLFRGRELRAGEREAEVRAAMRNLAVALIQRDMPAIERLLADDFTGFDSAGVIVSKAEWLEAIAAGDLVFERIHADSVDMTVLKDAVHVRAQLTFRARYTKSNYNGTFRCLGMYVRHGETWKLLVSKARVVGTGADAAEAS
ncbi:MAG TPA: isocitrate lyase/phosphoenolpyruvate mutase family protein [Thermoanaerobaculia bacterium]|jgi:2-methylisocitrate lyase-like PEP mutase family enzyme/ketosteroid isomerase-like protein